MTDPFPVGDIWVVGQRRAGPGQPFPTRGGGTSGGGDDGGGIHQNEVNESDPNEPYAVDPCADPALAPEWNADAAAAEAMREFRRQASLLGDDDLYTRERHAFLYRDTTGQVRVGVISHGNAIGPNNSGSVIPNWTGITPDNLVGSIHNHPGGGMTPSGVDWSNFDIIRNWIGANTQPNAADNYRLYMIARDVSDPNSQMGIRVYNHTSQRSSEAPGPEVNPDAQACP